MSNWCAATPPRVRIVKPTGDAHEDTARMKQAAGGLIDCVLDLLPPSASTATVRAAAMTVREYGRIVLLGGVGMLGGDDLALPYPWIVYNNTTVRGQWMLPREALVRMIGIIRSGLLRLDDYAVTEFALHDVNAAIGHAAVHARMFHSTMLRPRWFWFGPAWFERLFTASPS